MLGPVELVAEVDSTNRIVMERARAGAPEGLVVVADHQTSGHGRLGRVWEAPPGSSLLVSVLLRPDLDAGRTHVLTMAAALAAAEACEQVAGARPTLKWPNDLLLGEPERKVAGLLAEADIRGGIAVAVVVGMGLNVNWPLPLPPDLQGIATSLNEHAGGPVDRRTLLDAWLLGLDARLSALDRVLDEYRQRCSTLGRRVRIEQVDGVIEGEAGGVDEQGRLVVETASRSVSVAVGDVVHLRRA